MSIEKLKKRDGRLVSFDKEKIAEAINKAFIATYKPGQEATAERLADEVVSILEVEGLASPDVEHIQEKSHPPAGAAPSVCSLSLHKPTSFAFKYVAV